MFPEYCTITGCNPADSVDMTRLALPEDSVTAGFATPSIVNMTVPVGVPAPGEVVDTFDDNVIDWPNRDVLWLDVTVVIVLAWFTV